MDTPRSSYPTFSWPERRCLLRALEQAHDARLDRRLRAVAEIAEGESVAVVAKRARVARSIVGSNAILLSERHPRWLMANDPVDLA
jgi:hypothetical protein